MFSRPLGTHWLAGAWPEMKAQVDLEEELEEASEEEQALLVRVGAGLALATLEVASGLVRARLEVA